MKAGTARLVSGASFVVALSIVMSGCGTSSEDVNTSSQGPTPSPTYEKGSVPVPVGPPNASVIANSLLTPEPGNPCGQWSAEDGSVGSYVTAHYGDERDCGLFYGTWVITTLGLQQPDGSRSSGVVALYHCAGADSGCLDGTTDHPLNGWSFVSPPYAGGVTLLGVREPDEIIVDNAGRQMLFNVMTGEFTP